MKKRVLNLLFIFTTLYCETLSSTQRYEEYINQAFEKNDKDSILRLVQDLESKLNKIIELAKKTEKPLNVRWYPEDFELHGMLYPAS